MNSDGSHRILWHLLMTDGLQTFRYHGSRFSFRKKLWNRIEKSGNVQNTARTIAEALMDFVTSNRYPKEIDKLIQKEILSLAAHLAEKYRVGANGLLHAIMHLHFETTNSFFDWFDFLNPSDHKKNKESMVYPFKQKSDRNSNNWLTSRHLRALDYYLSCSWKMIAYARIDRTLVYAGEY